MINVKKAQISKKLQICIIIGGNSVEHEISLISGLQTILALDHQRYNCHVLYITKNNEMLYGENLKNLDTYKSNDFKKCRHVSLISENNKTYIFDLKNKHKTLIHIFIPVVHGKGCEDGTIRGLLDSIGATSTMPTIKNACICQNKALTKLFLKKNKIKVLPSFVADEFQSVLDVDKKINKTFGYPVIIKPLSLGSSIGIEIAKNIEELKKSLENVKRFEKYFLVEKSLSNFLEFNCAAYRRGYDIKLSCVEKINNQHEMYTYEDKYSNKFEPLEFHELPANIDMSLQKEILETTKKVYNIFDFNEVVRIDYLYVDSNLYVSEINTIPGSLAFYLFEPKGISFKNLLDDLIKEAMLSKEKEKKYLTSFNESILFSNNFKQKK